MSSSRPPLSTTTSLWPAATVLLVAAVTLVGFTLINVLASTGVTKNSTTTTVLIVGGLSRDFSNRAATGCEQNENPPANIASALLLPVDTKEVSGPLFANQGAGDFSCSLHFVTKHGSGALLAFYKNNLQALGWKLFSQGSSSGTPQFLFQKAGSDGFYWIAGVTVNSQSKAGSRWSLRVYQNSGQI